MITHKKLTSTERERLSVCKKEGLSNKECARRLGRHVSSIGRELKRNRIRVATKYGKDWENIYEPIHAQHAAEERKQNAWFAKQPLKNRKVYTYVLKHLRIGWSPEQIAGRLREVDHKGEKEWQICHETIYQFIYKEKTDKTKQGLYSSRILNKRLSTSTTMVTITDHTILLYEYLRRKQTKRRKRNGRKVRRVRIPDRVSIHERPKEINDRKTFGHWEGDSIVGLGHRNGLHTEYERLSSFIAVAYMPKVNTESFVRAAEEIYAPLPIHAKQSSTLDNGSEHTDHKTVTKKQQIAFYFADPYSAWQRGGNENGNMWIRYYFPKGTDFSKISGEEIQDVIREINNRPRKRLGFRTPKEVFTKHLNILP